MKPPADLVPTVQLGGARRVGDSLTRDPLWDAATIVAKSDAALEPIDEEMPDLTEDRYELGEILGAGGMGEVRRCRDRAIGRDVARKTLLPATAMNADARKRFLREVRVQGQLEHPAIVPVYDLSAGADGSLVFTMRRVRGHTLHEILWGLREERASEASGVGGGAPRSGAGDFENSPQKSGAFDPYSRRKLLDAFARVCLAVDYAHTRGVVHRDLKPTNVMLGAWGEVYVLDWGIAKIATPLPSEAEQPAEELTGRGHVVGTPGYMAPEQMLGHTDAIDARTDVYALGAMLFEIVALRPLHDNGSFDELRRSCLEGANARPSAVTTDAPPELDAICVKATKTSPDERFGSAREIAAAIERFLDGDRDLERRRELAGERADRAAVELSRALDPSVDARAAEDARAESTRQVTMALALDKDHAGARETLVRLFVEAPPRMPAAVEAEIKAAEIASRDQFVRWGVIGLLCWLAAAPIVVVAGVRAWPPVIAASVFTASAAVLALFFRSRRLYGAGASLVTTAVVMGAVASASCWLGPFVLVPQAAALTTLWCALQAPNKRERLGVVAIGSAATLLPFVLEWAGAVPGAYSFRADALVLHARAIELPPRLTIGILAYSAVGFVALPVFFLGRIRDALAAAERRVFLQSWQLRQVLPKRALSDDPTS